MKSSFHQFSDTTKCPVYLNSAKVASVQLFLPSGHRLQVCGQAELTAESEQRLAKSAQSDLVS